jgi:hypothetical protein
MPSINLPLSGAVNQTLLPWTNFLTVNMGQSSNPQVEEDVLSIASYGKQLGRVEDALNVLIRHTLDKLELSDEKDRLSEDEQRAIIDFKTMLNEIDKLKEGHNVRHNVRPKLR